MDPDTAARLLYLMESCASCGAPFDPDRHIGPRELGHIIQAACCAPGASDLQNVQLVVVDDPALLRELGELIAGAPLVIAVVFDPTQRAPEGDMLGMINLGCVLENMWLAARAERVDVQVVSALAAEAVEPEVRRVLHIPAPWRIAYVLRLGHAVAPHAEPRVWHEPERFVHRNGFGQAR